MPSCFALYSKTFPKSGPVILQGVDTLMCEHFGVEVNPSEWYCNWYNTIGLGLAMGHTWDKLRVFFPDKVEVIDWLEQHYTTEAWYEFKS